MRPHKRTVLPYPHAGRLVVDLYRARLRFALEKRVLVLARQVRSL